MEFYRRHASILKVLAHPARLKVLDLLTDRELTLAQVQEWVDVDPTSLARHLSLLRQVGLVKEQRNGRVLYFRADKQFVEPFLALLEMVEPQPRKEQLHSDWPVETH
jgi:ArsR family transcriptional regulator, arsenate/arsenite/antimonite-responsive transcriptional repressor